MKENLPNLVVRWIDMDTGTTSERATSGMTDGTEWRDTPHDLALALMPDLTRAITSALLRGESFEVQFGSSPTKGYVTDREVHRWVLEVLLNPSPEGKISSDQLRAVAKRICVGEGKKPAGRPWQRAVERVNEAVTQIREAAS